jgi:sortase (surface protein transpeptidase)
MLRIPRIGVESQLVRLGLDGARAMEVPGDPGEAGWYTKGPTPGALGPAVIAGHLTWAREPAIFFRLGELRRGDRVEVLRQDGRTAIFAIRRVVRVSKSRFPTDAVYGPTDHAALRLITCGGRYDDDRARYDDNVVVFAAMVDVREP